MTVPRTPTNEADARALVMQRSNEMLWRIASCVEETAPYPGDVPPRLLADVLHMGETEIHRIGRRQRACLGDQRCLKLPDGDQENTAKGRAGRAHHQGDRETPRG